MIVFRVADDIAYSNGPFDIFMHFRSYFINRQYPDWVVIGVNCRVCISFWLSIILVSWYWDIRYFAVAGIVSVITRFLNHNESD